MPAFVQAKTARYGHTVVYSPIQINDQGRLRPLAYDEQGEHAREYNSFEAAEAVVRRFNERPGEDVVKARWDFGTADWEDIEVVGAHDSWAEYREDFHADG